MAKRIPPESASDERLRRWHRLFGLLLTDHLAGSVFTVVLEMDLSQKQQFLDVVIVQRRTGTVTRPLPDGLDDLVSHNGLPGGGVSHAVHDGGLQAGCCAATPP